MYFANGLHGVIIHGNKNEKPELDMAKTQAFRMSV